MPTSTLVDRRARVTVTVTRANPQGQQVEQQYSFMDHRMRIMVRQGGGQFGNAKCEVYGVPLDSMNQIARLWLETLTPQNTDTLAIDVWDPTLDNNAGGFLPFFQGVITWSAVDASATPHVKLVIEANAAFALMNQSASAYSNAGPVSLQDTLTQIVTPAGFSVDYSAQASAYMLKDVHAPGAPLSQIDKLMRSFPDLTWFVNLQRLVVRQVNAPFSTDPIQINAATGLQGFPVYSTSGLQFQTVFNPRLRPGVALDVETPFEFVTRTLWVSSVIAHSLDVNFPNGHWTSAVAANSYGPKGNTQ